MGGEIFMSWQEANSFDVFSTSWFDLKAVILLLTRTRQVQFKNLIYELRIRNEW